jgi:hypothetical protein
LFNDELVATFAAYRSAERDDFELGLVVGRADIGSDRHQ